MKLIFLGCLSSSKYRDTCDKSIEIVKKIDSDYQEIEGAPCCGSVSFHTANDEEIKNHVDFVNDWLKENNVTDIVTICAGCYNYFTKYYPQYIPDFNINVQHMLQFIAAPENLKKLNLKNTGKKLAINYHDPCHLRNAVKPILKEPRDLLNSIENIELKEMENKEEFSLCCGSGGGVYSSFKTNAEYNSVAIFKQMRRTKALITSCPFCYTALKAAEENKSNKIRVPVIKLEDFIYKLIDGGDPLE